MNTHKELYPENNFDTLAILINYRKPYNEISLNAVRCTTISMSGFCDFK